MPEGPNAQQMAMTKTIPGEQEVDAAARYIADKYALTVPDARRIARDMVAFFGQEAIALRSRLNAAMNE